MTNDIKAKCFFQILQFIKDALKMMNFMEKENSPTQMEQN